eukprot:GSMAST32.ASY1.ANO1.2693.1 assembled CDS
MISRLLKLHGSSLPHGIGQYLKRYNRIQRFSSSTPIKYDVVIVGGGIMGSSSAYHLQKLNPNLRICVVERDLTYTSASTPLSVGSIRQQFSIEGNILMSMYGARFLKDIHKHLSVEGEEDADCGFVEGGYLFLASDTGGSVLKTNYKLQTSLGADVEIFSPQELKKKFGWLNVTDLDSAVLGVRNEGWFDPWLLLGAFKKKAISLGVDYIAGNVVGFDITKSENTSSPKQMMLEANHVINAAGPWAADIMALTDVQNFPVQPRKRMVFVLHCPKGPSLDCPLIVDPTGFYIRREGSHGNFICGKSPDTNDPNTFSHEVEHEFFEENIWPEC